MTGDDALWADLVAVKDKLKFPEINFSDLCSRIERVGKKHVRKGSSIPFRRSMYFGNTIGDLPNKEHLKQFKRNDIGGQTGYRSSTLIDSCKLENEPKLTHIVQKVIECLIHALKTELFGDKDQKSHLWQCNVNVYTEMDELCFHRDDKTESIQVTDNREQNRHVPLTNTFFPASATYILKQPHDKNVGLSVIVPLMATLHRKENGLVGRDPSPLQKGYDFIENVFNDDADPSTLVILKGHAYTHGIHSFNPNWNQGGQEKKRRISFNFRLVKESCWNTVHPSGFLPEHLL